MSKPFRSLDDSAMGGIFRSRAERIVCISPAMKCRASCSGIALEGLHRVSPAFQGRESAARHPRRNFSRRNTAGIGSPRCFSWEFADLFQAALAACRPDRLKLGAAPVRKRFEPDLAVWAQKIDDRFRYDDIAEPFPIGGNDDPWRVLGVAPLDRIFIGGHVFVP